MSRPRPKGELTGGDAFSQLIDKRRQSSQVQVDIVDADNQRKRETQTESVDVKEQRPQLAETGDDNGLRIQVKKGPTFEETHTRATFWMPNDLLDELDVFSRKTGLSKSQIVSRATRYFIDNAKIEE